MTSAPTFTKHSSQKRLMSLMPPKALDLVVDVLTYGAKKYSPNNWVNAPTWSTYYDAALRHLNAFWSGEDVDGESGLSHLGHAMCCIIFLAEFQRRGLSVDDRYTDVRVVPATTGTAAPDVTHASFGLFPYPCGVKTGSAVLMYEYTSPLWANVTCRVCLAIRDIKIAEGK